MWSTRHPYEISTVWFPGDCSENQSQWLWLRKENLSIEIGTHTHTPKRLCAWQWRNLMEDLASVLADGYRYWMQNWKWQWEFVKTNIYTQIEHVANLYMHWCGWMLIKLNTLFRVLNKVDLLMLACSVGRFQYEEAGFDDILQIHVCACLHLPAISWADTTDNKYLFGGVLSNQ